MRNLHEFYEQYGVIWSTTDRRELERMDTEYKVRTLCQLMNGINPKKILDFGCGLGDALTLLTAHFQAEQGIGLDVSSNMVNFAKKEHPSFNFVNGDYHKIGDFAVDLLTFIDVLEHLEDIQAALGMAKKHTKWIGIKIPLEKTWLICLMNALHLKEKKSRAYESEGHLYEFSKRDVLRILKKAELEIVDHKVCCVTTKNLLFGDLVRSRMKQKPGIVGKLKWLAYDFLSKLPFSLTMIMLRPWQGDDLYVLCKT